MTVLKNIPYARFGSHEMQLDLYMPDNPKGTMQPAILWVRGGGWYAGDKNGTNPCESFAQAGFVGVSI